MYIEDKELRDLFKAESEEHLQRLETGLLQLEKQPNDPVVLSDIFREAHSLKGAARMLGVLNVEMVAHRIEDILGEAKAGNRTLTSGVMDRIYTGLDAIRQWVHEAVTGEQVELDPQPVLRLLETGETDTATSPDEPPTPTPPGTAESSPPPVARKTERTPDSPAATSSGNVEPPEATRYTINTIRVDPQKLDALMTQSGELTVTKIRIARRLTQIEAMMDMWEEWNRDFYQHRFLFREVAHRLNGRGERFRDYLHREEERLEFWGTMLNHLKKELAEDNTKLDVVASRIEEGIRTIRLLPLSTIFNLFHRMVRDLAKLQEKQVQLVVEGGDTAADKRILEEMKDPLMHMIRNAIDHGLESPAERVAHGKSRLATIWLVAYQTATNVVIEVSDDGRGLNIERLKTVALQRGLCHEDELNAMTENQIYHLIFRPGFSTSSFVTDISGRGVGMDVVQKNVERLKGTIEVESFPGQGCTFRIRLPLTLATTRVLLVQVQGNSYALPVEYVQTTQLIALEDIFLIEGRKTITLEDRPVSVIELSTLLELKTPETSKTGGARESRLPCVILFIGTERLGLLVDALLDEQEVVLKPNSGILKRVRNVSGATILGSGEVCMVLNPQDLMRSVRKKSIPVVTSTETGSHRKARQVILLVEDSITTRTQEKRILESAGYEVITAVDGLDGLNKLNTRQFDAIVTDIEMPNMDGLEFAEKIRESPSYQNIPLVLVTSLASEEHKRRGMEVGADAYITKGTFDQQVLLDTLQRLI